VSGAWRSYFWLIGARRENARMAKLLDEHRLREAARSQLEAENERLRRLLGFKQTLPFETIGARVVARSPAPDFLTGVLVLDRGQADGVEPDSPVLVAGSVLGRTTVVTPRNAQVQLVTNPDAALGAMVERTRSPGVLGGSGELRLGLNYISNTEPIEVGDAVVTSGLDGIFPKGLPIGRVVLSRKGNSVFRVVEVEPSADLLRVEEVLVLVNHSPVRL
jgi:rod shape-determining protein MreC